MAISEFNASKEKERDVIFLTWEKTYLLFDWIFLDELTNININKHKLICLCILFNLTSKLELKLLDITATVKTPNKKTKKTLFLSKTAIILKD